MVVVTGGVGKLLASILAGARHRRPRRTSQPSFGAVYGKVLILVFVILFIQRWRWSGFRDQGALCGRVSGAPGLLAAAAPAVVLPALNALPLGSPFRISDFTLNLFGKFRANHPRPRHRPDLGVYGRAVARPRGVLRTRRYAMGMHLMLEIGTQSVYKNVLPDFMVWNQVEGAAALRRPVLQRGVHDLRSVGGSGRGGLHLRLPHLPELYPWRVLLDHHAGDGALRLAPVQPQSPNLAGPTACRASRVLRLHAERRGHPGALHVATVLCPAAPICCAAPSRRSRGKVWWLSGTARHACSLSGYSPDAFKLSSLSSRAGPGRRGRALDVPQVGTSRRRRYGVPPSINDHLGGGRRTGDAARADRRCLLGGLPPASSPRAIPTCGCWSWAGMSWRRALFPTVWWTAHKLIARLSPRDRTGRRRWWRAPPSASLSRRTRDEAMTVDVTPWRPTHRPPGCHRATTTARRPGTT